jgi:hypothetical protein
LKSQREIILKYASISYFYPYLLFISSNLNFTSYDLCR